MHWRLLAVFILFFLVQGSFASEIKGSLGGKIKDANTGLPLQGVSILISDVRAGAFTDAEGNYYIDNISEGYHLVEITHVGYSTIAENILISTGTKKDFLLSHSIVENNAVVVTGVAKATQLKHMPFQVSVLRRDDLLRNTSSNIIESISKRAGVSSISSGNSIAKPVIRGLGYNRVLTVQDGVRQEGQQWGDEHGIEIDESSIGKIEILKGPASLVYGSDAIGGVINMISGIPVPNNSIEFNIGSNYQANHDLAALNFGFAGNRNGLNWNMYASGKNAGDYKNSIDADVYNSKFYERNFGGYAGYNGSWGFSHILVSKFDQKAGMVEGERDAEGFFLKNIPGGGVERATSEDFDGYKPGFPFQHIRHFKITSDNNFRLGESRLILNTGWQRNQRQEYGDVDQPNQADLYFDLKTLTANLQMNLKESRGWKTSAGINAISQDNTNRGLEQIIPDYNMKSAGLFVISQKQVSKTFFSGGIRYDHRKLDVNDLIEDGIIKGNRFRRNFSDASASFGITSEFAKNFNLKLNIARAFRAPSVAELASNGAHEGTNRYEYGTNNLKSETSWQGDAAIEFNNEHFSLNLAGYYNLINDFIFYRKLNNTSGTDSIVIVDGEELMAFQFAQNKAALQGMEFTLDIHPHPLDWLHFQNTFSYVRGRFNENVGGTKDLPLMPAPRLLTELRADVKKLGRLSNFYARVEMDNTFEQDHAFVAYNTETITPGYTLFNAGIGSNVQTKKGNTVFTWHMAINNIADHAYQSHLSRLKYAPENPSTGRQGIYNMGRNFSIKLNVPVRIKFRN